MALILSSLQLPLVSTTHYKHQPLTSAQFIYFRFTSRKTKLRSPFCLSPLHRSRRLSHVRSAPINGSIDNYSVLSEEQGIYTNADKFRKLFDLVRTMLPGGTWWNLSDDLVDVVSTAKPVTIWRALWRMWELVANDRWVIFTAFSSLVVAALSEILIPHFLTATIFSAQSGHIMVFQRNVLLLVLFCMTSGICSGLRGFCFSIANMILVKRMRETLYSALLFQDVAFFDDTTVGDLTSRLGADCQQVSRVIGNDLNLISRNILQGTGSLIYLLILSWPLGSCTLVICVMLAAVMLIYGQYQKKAARLTQEFNASANEVAQETISLMRTVRVYGTEQLELGRYQLWLKKLADISVRQGAAYGFWSLGFNVLYHSTQDNFPYIC